MRCCGCDNHHCVQKPFVYAHIGCVALSTRRCARVLAEGCISVFVLEGLVQVAALGQRDPSDRQDDYQFSVSFLCCEKGTAVES